MAHADMQQSSSILGWDSSQTATMLACASTHDMQDLHVLFVYCMLCYSAQHASLATAFKIMFSDAFTTV